MDMAKPTSVGGTVSEDRIYLGQNTQVKSNHGPVRVSSSTSNFRCSDVSVPSLLRFVRLVECPQRFPNGMVDHIHDLTLNELRLDRGKVCT